MGRIGFILVAALIGTVLGGSVYDEDYDRRMHPARRPQGVKKQQGPPVEDAEFWKSDAQTKIKGKLAQKYIENQAKNVIFYLGDGMSVPTITAARILKGQKVDNLPFGEEGELHLDSFPWTGVSKTFCSDAQVADSACSATAYLCGTKANSGTMGVTPDVLRYNCTTQADSNNHVDSVLAWAQAQGKSTGVVTTTRITHASPGGTYAHIANRDWESDGNVIVDGGDPTLCEDIAAQLIKREPGINIDVILGGGRRHFIPQDQRDPETNQTGYRLDGQDLIAQWKARGNDTTHKYVTTKQELLAVDVTSTEKLLGLFAPSHLGYLDEQEDNLDPSLEDMVDVAIKILSKNEKGFFIFVEGGRIDHAHHDNHIQRSLWETIEFDKAIKKGDDMTADDDTLIVITSDHAHIMSFAGYPDRGNDILRHSVREDDDIDRDGLRYNTLGYINGPGTPWFDAPGQRHNISGDDFDSPTYQPPIPIPLSSETHGGDDVLIFAKGPYGHLLTGVQQQSYIPHVVAYAACIGEGESHCGPMKRDPDPTKDGSSQNTAFILMTAICVFLNILH